MTDKKRVVVLGGGTGQAVMLRGLKQIEDIELTAIVTVADDGGSTGRLRRSFHIPAMGKPLFERIYPTYCKVKQEKVGIIGENRKTSIWRNYISMVICT